MNVSSVGTSIPTRTKKNIGLFRVDRAVPWYTVRRDETRTDDRYGHRLKARDKNVPWKPVPDVGEGCNPPALIPVENERPCLTYSIRSGSFRICAKLSSDHGMSSGDEIVLPDDGANKYLA